MSDYDCRSLLQKAIRRGQSELMKKVLLHLEATDGFTWVRNRAGVILSEENYSLLAQLSPQSTLADIYDLFLQTTNSSKQKDAFALASLAFWEREGIQKIKLPPIEAALLEEYLSASEDFPAWGKTNAKTLLEMDMLRNALQASRRAGFPADKAFPLAAAFLYIRAHNPSPAALIPDVDLPLWVALDKHTGAGRIALDKASRQLQVFSGQV